MLDALKVLWKEEEKTEKIRRSEDQKNAERMLEEERTKK